MAENSITEYAKRIGKSIAFATSEVLKEQLPVTTSIINTNKETAKNLFKEVTNSKQQLARLEHIEDTYIFKPANTLIQNVKADLATGNFYNQARKEAADEEAMGSMLSSLLGDELSGLFDDDSDLNLDENGEIKTSEGIRGIPTVTKGDVVVSQVISRNSRASTSVIAKALTKSTEASIKTNRIIANMQARALEKQSRISQTGFSAMAHGFNSIIEFNNKVMNVHAKNSQLYFEEMTRISRENNAILKEMVEMQRSAFKKTVTPEDKKKPLNPLAGGFNLKDYMEIVKQNSEGTMIGQAFMFLPMIQSVLSDVVANPMHFVSKQMISSILGPSLKTAMQSFDKSVKGFINTGLAKLFDYGKKNGGILGDLATLFGYKQLNPKLANSTTKFDKGPRQWDGLDHKVLTQVIPAYLSRIEAAVTGGPERFFDSHSGKFTNANKIKAIEKAIDRKNTKNAMAPLRNEMLSTFAMATGKDLKNKKDLEQMNGFVKDLDRLMSAIYDIGYLDQNTINSIRTNKNGKFARNKAVASIFADLLESQGVRGTTKLNVASNVNAAKRSKQEMINGNEDSPYAPYAQARAMRTDRWAINGRPGLTERFDGNYQKTVIDLLSDIRDNTSGFLSGLRSKFGRRGKRGRGSNSGTIVNNHGGNKRGKHDETPEYEQSKKFLGGTANEIDWYNYIGFINGIDSHDINWDKLQESEGYRRRVSEKLKGSFNQVGKVRKQEDLRNNSGMLDSVANFLGFNGPVKGVPEGVDPNSGFFKQLMQAGSIGDKIGVISANINKIANAPKAVMENLFMTADKAMYNIFFDKDTNEKDDQGRPIKGLFNKMTHMMDKSMDNLNKKINGLFKSVYENKDKILGNIENFAENWLGIDVKGIKEKVSGFTKNMFSGVKSGLRGTVNTFKDAITGTLSDIGFGKKSGSSTNTGSTNRSNKSSGTRNVKRGGLAFISPGEAIIPADLNPWNPHRDQVNREQQSQNEARMKQRFASGLKSSVGKQLANTIPTHANGTLNFDAGTAQQLLAILSSANPQDVASLVGPVMQSMGINPIDLLKYIAGGAGTLAGKAGKAIPLIDNDAKKQLSDELVSKIWHSKELRKNKDNQDIFKKFIESGGYDVSKLPSNEHMNLSDRSHKSGPLNGILQGLEVMTGKDPVKAAGQVKDYVVKNTPEIVKGGALGGILSTVFPLGGPLMGALAGSAVSLLSKNKTFMEYMFGKEVADGKGGTKKEGGLIPESFVKTFEKYYPDAKKYGITGGLIGMITPFGPLGGIMAGVGASILKNNKTANDFLFGDKNGLLNKDRKAAIKRAFPHMGAAMLGTFFLGPFGLLGNAALGAGIGLLSTTETFKSIMLGRKDKQGNRHGGLVGAIRRNITNPLKRTKFEIAKWFKNQVAKPAGRGMSNIGKLISKEISRGANGFFKAVSKRLFGGTIFEKVFDKLTGGIRKAGGVGAWLGKGVGNLFLGLPAKGIEKLGNVAERHMLSRGMMTDMTAAQRLQRARELNMNANKYTGVDAGINDIRSVDDLKRVFETSKSLSDILENGEGSINKRKNETVDDMISKLSELSEAEGNEKVDYSKLVGYVDKLKKSKHDVDIMDVIKDLNKDESFSSEKEKDKVREILLKGNEEFRNADASRKYLKGATRDSAIANMRGLFGSTMTNEDFIKELPNITKLLGAELGMREEQDKTKKLEAGQVSKTTEVDEGVKIEGQGEVINSLEDMNDSLKKIIEIMSGRSDSTWSGPGTFNADFRIDSAAYNGAKDLTAAYTAGARRMTDRDKAALHERMKNTRENIGATDNSAVRGLSDEMLYKMTKDTKNDKKYIKNAKQMMRLKQFSTISDDNTAFIKDADAILKLDDSGELMRRIAELTLRGYTIDPKDYKDINDLPEAGFDTAVNLADIGARFDDFTVFSDIKDINDAKARDLIEFALVKTGNGDTLVGNKMTVSEMADRINMTEFQSNRSGGETYQHMHDRQIATDYYGNYQKYESNKNGVGSATERQGGYRTPDQIKKDDTNISTSNARKAMGKDSIITKGAKKIYGAAGGVISTVGNGIAAGADFVAPAFNPGSNIKAAGKTILYGRQDDQLIQDVSKVKAKALAHQLTIAVIRNALAKFNIKKKSEDFVANLIESPIQFGPALAKEISNVIQTGDTDRLLYVINTIAENNPEALQSFQDNNGPADQGTIGNIQNAGQHAFGLSALANGAKSLASKGLSALGFTELAGNLIGGNKDSDKDKDKDSDTTQETSTSNADTTKQALTTSADVKAAGASLGLNGPASTGGDNVTLSNKKKKTGDTSTYVSTPYGPLQYDTSSTDGQPMELKNKQNFEVNKKLQHDEQRKERSVSALERIAAKIDKLPLVGGVAAAAKKKGKGLFDMLKDLAKMPLDLAGNILGLLPFAGLILPTLAVGGKWIGKKLNTKFNLSEKFNDTKNSLLKKVLPASLYNRFVAPKDATGAEAKVEGPKTSGKPASSYGVPELGDLKVDRTVSDQMKDEFEKYRKEGKLPKEKLDEFEKMIADQEAKEVSDARTAAQKNLVDEAGNTKSTGILSTFKRKLGDAGKFIAKHAPGRIGGTIAAGLAAAGIYGYTGSSQYENQGITGAVSDAVNGHKFDAKAYGIDDITTEEQRTADALIEHDVPPDQVANRIYQVRQLRGGKNGTNSNTKPVERKSENSYRWDWIKDNAPSMLARMGITAGAGFGLNKLGVKSAFKRNGLLALGNVGYDVLTGQTDEKGGLAWDAAKTMALTAGGGFATDKALDWFDRRRAALQGQQDIINAKNGPIGEAVNAGPSAEGTPEIKMDTSKSEAIKKQYMELERNGKLTPEKAEELEKKIAEAEEAEKKAFEEAKAKASSNSPKPETKSGTPKAKPSPTAEPKPASGSKGFISRNLGKAKDLVMHSRVGKYAIPLLAAAGIYGATSSSANAATPEAAGAPQGQQMQQYQQMVDQNGNVVEVPVQNPNNPNAKPEEQGGGFMDLAKSILGYQVGAKVGSKMGHGHSLIGGTLGSMLVSGDELTPGNILTNLALNKGFEKVIGGIGSVGSAAWQSAKTGSLSPLKELPSKAIADIKSAPSSMVEGAKNLKSDVLSLFKPSQASVEATETAAEAGAKQAADNSLKEAGKTAVKESLEDGGAKAAESKGTAQSIMAKAKESVNKAIKAASKYCPSKGAVEALRGFGNKLLEKLASPQVMKKAITIISKQTAGLTAGSVSMGIGTLVVSGAIAVTSFITAYNSADKMLKIPEGSATQGMKILCGFVSSLSALPGIGILAVIAEDYILKFAIKHLAPAFGFSEKDLEALREKGDSDDKEVGEKPFKKVVSKMNDVQESIMQSVKGTVGSVVASASSAAATMSDYATAAAKKAGNIASSVTQTVSNGINAIGDWIKDSTIYKGAQSAASKIGDMASNGIQAAKDFATKAKDYISDKASGVADWFSDKYNKAKKSVLGEGKHGLPRYGRGDVDIDSMSSIEDIRNAISDIPNDQIASYNQINDSDSLMVAKAKAKKIRQLASSNNTQGQFYSQLDPQFAMEMNVPGDTEYQTMADSGCGPVSAVNALSSLGINANPMDAATYAMDKGYKENNGGIRPEFFGDFMGNMGVPTKNLHSTDDVTKSLQNGNPVVLMGTDSAGESSRTPYAENPHYVTATGLDGRGNMIVQDPESDEPNKVYKASNVLNKSTIAIAAGMGKYSYSRYGRARIDGKNLVTSPSKMTINTPINQNNPRKNGSGRGKYGRGGEVVSKEKMWALANWCSQKCGVAADLIYGQWYLESGGFSSQLARENYNFGGMTQSEPTGDPADKQPDGGNYYMHFSSPEEWAEYFAWYLNREDNPTVGGMGDPDEYAKALKSNGYMGADTSEYAAGIKNGINNKPSGGPNMGLIDQSKFGKRDPGSPSKAAPNSNANQNNGQNNDNSKAVQREQANIDTTSTIKNVFNNVIAKPFLRAVGYNVDNTYGKGKHGRSKYGRNKSSISISPRQSSPTSHQINRSNKFSPIRSTINKVGKGIKRAFGRYKYGRDGNNPQIIWDYLAGKGLSSTLIAAIMGNMQAESGYDPGAIEPNGEGHGLVQWSFERWRGPKGLQAYAQSKGTDWRDINTQLDFLWTEIGPGGPYNKYVTQCNGITDIKDCTKQWYLGYEMGGASENQIRWDLTHLDRRQSEAEKAFQTQGKGIATNGSNNNNSGDNGKKDGGIFGALDGIMEAFTKAMNPFSADSSNNSNNNNNANNNSQNPNGGKDNKVGKSDKLDMDVVQSNHPESNYLTNLTDLQPDVNAALNIFGKDYKQRHGEKLMITGGAEKWVHADGKWSHHTGWKTDLVGINDQDVQQMHNMGACVNNEGDHWDIDWSGHDTRSGTNTGVNGVGAQGKHSIRSLFGRGKYGRYKYGRAQEENSTNSNSSSNSSTNNTTQNTSSTQQNPASNTSNNNSSSSSGGALANIFKSAGDTAFAPLKAGMKFFGGMLKTAMENSGFDANQKFLFGSNRILESFGLNNGNNGGNNSSNASNGALSGDIQAASKWAESMVGHTGYGGNGCTEFVKNYLLHANSQLGKYMQDCSPIMDQVKKAAANNGDKPYETLMWVPTLYEWAKEQNVLKGPDQPGAEGDVCICNDIGHVVIADGKGGFWGNSSSRNQIIHSNSISQTFTIQGYIPTGSGSGTVSNDKKVLTAAQSNAEAGATNNAASGKHGRYGRGLPAYVEDFDTANSMDAVNVPFDIKSAASKDNFKTSMYGMRRHRKRLSSAPDTQKAIPKIEDFKQEGNNNPYTKIFSTQDAMFGNMNSIGEIKEFINSNYDTSKIPDYNMISDSDDLTVAKAKAANIVKKYPKKAGMGKYGMRRHHKNSVSVATPVVQQKTFAQDPYSRIFNMQDYMFGDINSVSEIKKFIESNYDLSQVADYNMINDDDSLIVAKTKASTIMKQCEKVPGIDTPTDNTPSTTQSSTPAITQTRTFDNSKYGQIFGMQDYMFGDINSVSEIKKFIEDNYDVSQIPDYNMINDDDDLLVAKSKAANIVKQYTKIPGMGKGKYGRGLGGFISKAKNLFSKAKDIWNKIKPYKDKISSLFHHKKKDNKSINNDTKKDPKQLEEEYLKAHLITADVESMKTKDEIKNAIKDIPEDSILEYNKITGEDDLTVAKAKAKKTIELYNEEVRKKAKEYAANGGEDKSKTNESNAESSDKKEEPVVDEIAPNGEHYTKNDVDYLLSKGYTREAAIELLSKDKKYTTKKKDGKNEEVVEEIAPNGEHYSKNDVDYLMNNGYSREAAIALLSKDKKYTEKPEEKQEEKKKLNRRITDTYADDYDTPEERQKAREENDAKLKAEKEAKEKEKKNRSSKDKDEEVVEEVAPNGEHYSKNDVDYLLSKGYSRQAAIELLSKDKKYTEKPKDKKDKKTSKYAAEVAPNGKHYTNNDIQYLLDKGYSRQAAIELLSKDKKYTESTDDDEDEDDEDEESDNDSKKTRRRRHRRRRLNVRITDTRADDEENASEEESEKQLERNDRRLRRRRRHRRRSEDEDYDEDEELEEEDSKDKKSNKYSKVKAPNGEYYETNDIKYLTDHGYSEKAAIELLSKDKKYTTKKYHHKRKYSKIQAPNGEYYSNNDIDYLMNNGYTKKAAIELLSKDKKYTNKKDDRKTAIEKIGDNASSVTKVSTSTADAKAAEENQKLKPIDVNVDNLRTKEEFDEALKDIPEDKILEYNKIQDGDDILVMRAKAKKTIALYNAYVKDHNDKIDKAEAEKKAKEANNKDAKTPNKEESKKNEEAVSVGKKDEEKDSKDKDKNKDEKSKTKEFEYKDGKKHNMKLSDKVAPNGMHFLQNDIDYLVNKGYSEDDAIALLSEDPRYKEESDKTNNDNNGDSTPSGAVSAKTKENKKSKIDDLIAKQEETNKLLAAILQIATQYVGNTAAAPANNPKINANETKNVNTGEVGSDIYSIKSALSKKYGGSKFGLGDGYMRQSTGRSYETIFHSLDLISTR